MTRISTNILKHSVFGVGISINTSSIIVFLSLLIALFYANVTSGQAGCNIGVYPYACAGTSSVSAITTTTATFSGSAGTYNGVGVSGFVWGTTSTPTTTVNTGMSTTGTTGTNVLANFTYNVTGLTPGTTYYVRAYVIDAYGNPTYGVAASFTTTTAGPVTVTTATTSAIAATTATSGGTVTLVSGAQTITERGVVYSTSPSPTTATGTKVTSGTGYGTYSTSLTGLTSSTTYYVRAYAIASNGTTYYGTDQTFTTSFQPSSIVSPFSLTPAWYWGTKATYKFASGSFPAVTPGPTIGSVATTVASPETSTSVSFRNGNVAVYTNSMKAWNSANTQLKAFDVAGEMTCAGSSAGGGVAFPDPANNATNDAFYLILGNDVTGGACASATGPGVNQYRVSGTSTSMSTISAKTATPLEDAAFATEAIAAGTDGDGGYWLVVHDKTATNKFRVWHYTASGVSGPVEYQPATTAPITSTLSSGYLKFSPCMNMLAFAGFNNNAITVYNFNRTTGAIGTQIAVKTGVGTSGLEFSPDGTKIYYSGQGLQVGWFLISNPATGGTIAGSASWTMQMGPDAQIYTSGIGSNPATWGTSDVGVINNPNGSATYSTMTLTGGALSYRGLNNLAWLSPQTPKLAATATSCNVTFKYSFLNYFNDTVTTKDVEWSWDNGATWTAGTNPQSHTFAHGTNYNVRVRFKDSYCSQLWTNAPVASGTVSCPLPVSWLNISANNQGRNVLVNWSTTSEKNNSYFIIEKSVDGQNFSPIGKVAGAVNSTVINQYHFIDSNPEMGENYYRIVQYDLDNSSSYSNVVVTSNEKYFNVAIAPNPSQNDFELKIYSQEEEATISVLDLLGREIFNSTTSNFEGIRFGADFAKGTYIIRVISGDNSITQKIIKQ